MRCTYFWASKGGRLLAGTLAHTPDAAKARATAAGIEHDDCRGVTFNLKALHADPSLWHGMKSMFTCEFGIG